MVTRPGCRTGLCMQHVPGVESQVGGCDLLTQSLGGCPRRCLWGSDFVYVSPGPRSNGGGSLLLSLCAGIAGSTLVSTLGAGS